MDITPITATIGAITGCASLIWNITTHLGFDLEFYSHFLSFDYNKNAIKSPSIFLEKNQDVSKYADDALVLRGWFKFLLRKEGKRFKNHHVNLLSIGFEEEPRNFLEKILVDPASHIVLFPDQETKDLKLFEGSFLEVNVHSNSLWLKKDWKDRIDLQKNDLKETLYELIKKEKYKVNVNLTTYKYPLVFEKKGAFFQHEHLGKRALKVLRRPVL